MWYTLGKFILKYRLLLLILLIGATAFMAYKAKDVQLSYEFTRAIPTSNQKYIDYQNFRQKFGGDGNTLVLGIEAKEFFTVKNFNAAKELQRDLKAVNGVKEILSAPASVVLLKDSNSRFVPIPIFAENYTSQQALDSAVDVFKNQPFYNSILYNDSTNAYLFAITVDSAQINSKERSALIGRIKEPIEKFAKATGAETHLSGLPFIRTEVGDKIKNEMNWFLIGSLLLSAITLLIFFRSFTAMFISLLVVGIGVVFSLGTIVLCGYKITLLIALIPPLIVVIGVPNCIYFLNKYHTSFLADGDKRKALENMVGRMGIVTLFCNIAAAVGFAVFALTSSELLREFGVVSGINIMALFFISLIFIPAVLSYLPAPKPREFKYLKNAFLEKVLNKIEHITFYKSKPVLIVTVIVTLVAVAGCFKLKSEGFIVDDLPKEDKIYTDLKWFEQNFEGVMPLEIVIDTKKRKGLQKIKTLEKIDSFSMYIASLPETARPLSLVEALKFAKQAFYDNDSLSYTVPSGTDFAFMVDYLQSNKDSVSKESQLSKTVKGFVDSNFQVARISVNMKDIGSAQLLVFLDSIQRIATATFDTAQYNVTFTGATVTFLEGSNFIINGLKESIFWAFLCIAVCMLFLFRSVKILLCSLIPNIIPLVITAGVMGWMGISLKPSTVLVFSVALGIVIDVTIRFLINYKQELPLLNSNVNKTLSATIKHTGISIIYTSLVLIAGFIIFCFSSFGGTKALGWLTSFTLVTGTLTNLILLPVIMKMINKTPKSA